MTRFDHDYDADDPHPFSKYLAALGRGPGRSRSLTRDEAFEAMSMVLDGRADELQVGAFLLLLRYRHENADEVAGLAEAIRHHEGLPRLVGDGRQGADLDWPSYAAGRTRGAPWFLLSALLLAQNGVRVAMHGFNSHLKNGTLTEQCLAALDLPVAASVDEARVQLSQRNFTYMPLRNFSPVTQDLLGLRPLLGLRTAVNTVVRTLNPLNAPASFVGIFHPPYLDVQLGAAQNLGTARVGVIKGGGGEAERTPFKPVMLSLNQDQQNWQPMLDKSLGPKVDPATLDHLLAVWRGGVEDAVGRAVVIGTAAQALVVAARAANQQEAEAQAAIFWDRRLEA
ncbi:MAG: glycosyl transferase family protein [Alphaproteobacteria bacterium]